MSHPLDEAEHTPWGQKVDRDIVSLQGRVRKMDHHMTEFGTELKRNSELTKTIKEDTQWMRDMFRGSKALGRFLIGLSVIFGAIAAIGVWLGWMTGHK